MPGIFRHPPQAFQGGSGPLLPRKFPPVAPFTTFALFGSGGLSAGGGATFSKVANYTGAGGASMSGVAGASTVAKAYTGSGGASMAGAATFIVKRRYSGTSGVTASGAASTSLFNGVAINSYTGTGGVVTSGAAPTSVSHAFRYTSSVDGFIVIAWDAVAGATGYKLYYDTNSGVPYTGTGSTQGNSPIDVGNVTQFTIHGLTPYQTYYFAITAYDSFGQEGAYSAELSDFIQTSIFHASGSARVNIGKGHVATGGAILSGAAGLRKIKRYPGTGGVTTAGAATTSLFNGVVIKTYTGSGGLVTGGGAALRKIDRFIGSGGIVLSGIALPQLLKSYSGTGGVITGGAGVLSRVRAYTGTGGVTTDGTATAIKQGPGAGIFPYTGSGGLVTSGVATLRKINRYIVSQGGVITGGGAFIFRVRKFYTGSGGLVTGGGASAITIGHGYTGTGGVVMGGAADTSKQASQTGQFFFFPTGGVLSIGGSAILRVIRPFITSGGVDISGGASFTFRRGKTRLVIRQDIQLRLGDTAEQVWSAAELNSLIDEGYDELCRLTLAIWRRKVINDEIGEIQGQALYDLPDDFFQMDRVTWDHKRIEPLFRSEIEYASPSYETIEGTVDGYIMEEDGLDQIRLFRVPAETGTKTILEYYALPIALINDDSTFEIPYRYAKYIRHFVMWRALEKNGPGQDLKLAEHYKTRWSLGIARMIDRRDSMNAKRVGRFGGESKRGVAPPKPMLPWDYGEVE